MSITKSTFGVTRDGTKVTAYTMDNGKMSVRLIDLGGIIVSINVPDKNGAMADVVCGYDDPDSYLTCSGYPGAIIGRYCNRIGNAEFTVDGVKYQVYKNDNVHNHLHGGKVGFDRRMWNVSVVSDNDKEMSVDLSYVSPDGEEGYPGTLTVHVYYTLSKGSNDFSIHYVATTDKRTILNLTNHSYFNLAGYDVGNILDHEVMINSDAYGEVDSELIPTGKIINVEGTPHDFRTAKPVGRDIGCDDTQLKYGQGYDHNFILNNGGRCELAAKVRDPKSGRVMTVFTDQPAIQLYTGNCIDVTEAPYKGGVPKRRFAALCLETQHYPDSPNHPEFPSTELAPGEVYDYTTVFSFSAE